MILQMASISEFYRLFGLRMITLCFFISSISFGLFMGFLSATATTDRIKLGFKMGLLFGVGFTPLFWLTCFLIFLVRR